VVQNAGQLELVDGGYFRIYGLLRTRDDTNVRGMSSSDNDHIIESRLPVSESLHGEARWSCAGRSVNAGIDRFKRRLAECGAAVSLIGSSEEVLRTITIALGRVDQEELIVVQPVHRRHCSG
jgi:hypothetical protein